MTFGSLPQDVRPVATSSRITNIQYARQYCGVRKSSILCRERPTGVVPGGVEVLAGQRPQTPLFSVKGLVGEHALVVLEPLPPVLRDGAVLGRAELADHNPFTLVPDRLVQPVSAGRLVGQGAVRARGGAAIEVPLHRDGRRDHVPGGRRGVPRRGYAAARRLNRHGACDPGDRPYRT